MCTCGSNINGNLCCYDEQAKQTLGLVATSYRDIKSGREFEHYFPKSSITEKIVVPDGTVRDTVDEIEKIVKQYNWQTKAIASTFKRASLPETLNAIWDFFYNHYQYKLDRPEVEELRTPARAWHDRKTGIDCDCYSISISCVLTNLGINHKFRVTKYGAGWQHIYVIVPVPNSIKNEYWVLDCVLDRFNYEKTYTDKFDYKMENLGIPIAVLGGTDDTELQTILSGADFDEPGFGATSSLEDDLGALKKHLVRTRNYIVRNPQSVIYNGGAAKNVKMFNHAIKHWDNENLREQALHGLAEAEHDMNVQLGLAGFDEYDPDEDVTLMGVDEDATYDEVNVLGKVKGKKKFWQAVKNVNKKIVDAHKKVGKKALEVAKKAGKKFVEINKKIFKAVVRFNPLTLAARGGFLLVMKTNMFGFAKALYPATISESEAKAKGYSDADIAKAKKAWGGITKIFVKVLQGKEDNLKKQIRQGANHYFKKHPIKSLKGFESEESLGEPISTGVSVTAASSALAAGAKVMSSAGLTAGGGKSFMQIIANFFKKNKDKILNVAKKGVQMIKNRKKKGGEGGEGGESGSSESGEPESESETPSEPGENGGNASRRAATSTESDSNDDDNSDAGTDDKTPIDSTPDKKTSSSTARTESDSSTTDEDGFFAKAKNWAKENPGKATAIGVTAAAAITLAVSPKARAFVSNLFGGKKKAGLSGVKRKKRVSAKRKSTKSSSKKVTRYKLK
jgi:hypothetical protein